MQSLSLSHAIADAADWLKTLPPWRRLIAAFVAGALSALAFAPFGIFPLLLLSYAALLLALDGVGAMAHPLRSSFFLGWAYGFGQFLVGVYWVGYAFLVDANAHEWEIPFVEILLPGGLALFPALAAFLYAAFRKDDASRIFLFAFAFGAAEYLRGHVFTGFPWNLSGYGWSAALGVLQSAAVIGAYGLSLLTILFGASLALVAESKSLLPAAMTILFAAMWTGGEARLAFANQSDVAGVRLRIVQPGISQREKYQPEFVVRNWERLLDLSRAPGAAPTHIIWPEAAPPFLLAREPVAMSDIAALTRDGAILLTGAVRAGMSHTGKPHYFNSFYVFGRQREPIATYDKFHLVPFGEYMPLQKTMDALGITKVTGGPGGFTAGDGPHTVQVPGAPPISPLICYEAIFPGEVTGAKRPGWLVNVTDDSWFGPGTGPKQHLLSARVRAIEEGLPIARAANTGISAVIDAYGRIRGALPLGAAGALNTALPASLSATPYARFGNVTTLLLFFVCAGLVLAPLRVGRT